MDKEEYNSLLWCFCIVVMCHLYIQRQYFEFDKILKTISKN